MQMHDMPMPHTDHTLHIIILGGGLIVATILVLRDRYGKKDTTISDEK